MAEIILRYGGNYLKGSDLLFMPLFCFARRRETPVVARIDKRSWEQH
jgi:hypothetical protein